tara:strand:- start:388 stop:876 length:489 start_codon:yes stop_codon:yes gene_type:complete
MTEDSHWYSIESEYKKSAQEEQFWANTLKNGKKVSIKVGNLYRWGLFHIKINESQKNSLSKKDSIVINDYEDYEMIEMMDGGCDFWIDIVDEDKYTEEELNEIYKLMYKWPEDNCPEDALDEAEEDEIYDEEKMCANNWCEIECEYTLNGPYKLEKIIENSI